MAEWLMLLAAVAVVLVDGVATRGRYCPLIFSSKSQLGGGYRTRVTS